ncbi:hypothetical protein E0Z10_g10480 [Xylaria hypoxylon]|uniref:DUF7896 domain-containing protein n=1 Tax=Xylaria hypoxylon TaxID=37992 RepID=A0A4Z0YHR1_9PEZI|nr:hypothetical protein E0Z10_g10480 [Xylaria hypoxylon]
MTEVKVSMPESTSVTTFLRTNLPGPRFRAKLTTIGQEGKLYRMQRIAETRAITTTDDSRDLATEVEAACVSSQNETDSGYGTTSFNRNTTQPTRTTLAFSRKPIPQQFLDRLLDIRALFTEPLLDTVSAKQRPTKGASMKLKYTDHDDSLYLVIQCDKRDKKRMRKFFAQDHVKEMIGDDITVHITTGLRQLATQELKVYGANFGVASCGTMIRIEGAHGSSMATLGGVITVVKEGRMVTYGLTAGHALSRLVHNSNRSSRSSWSDIENDSDTPYSSDESSDSSDNDQSEVFPGAPSELGSQIGNITEHSFQSTSSSANRDWALIELHPNQSISNLIHIPCSSGLCKPASITTLTFKPLISTPIQSPVNVIIPTSRGNQRGTLTSSTSSLLVAPGREFVETHDVVLDDGFALQPGDSGSWVIHETTGEVYGHVVSIDMLGEAYVMPLNHTLQDIQAHIHADYVGLPQESEKPIDTWKSTVQIEEYPGPLKKLALPIGFEGLDLDFLCSQMNDAPLPTREPTEELAPDEMSRSTSGGTFDSGYITDFPQLPNSVSFDTGSIVAHQADNARLPKYAKHQQAVKKVICVHPSTMGLKVNTPIIRPLEKCRACREEKKYGAYYNAAAHLRRTHFRGRPSRSKGSPAAIAASGRDPLNWPPMKELKSWLQEVWVDRVDSTSLDGEEESDAMMETEGLEQEETRTEDMMRKPDADANWDSQLEDGSLVTPVNRILELQPFTISDNRRVKLSSSPPALRGNLEHHEPYLHDSGIGNRHVFQDYTSISRSYDDKSTAWDDAI